MTNDREREEARLVAWFYADYADFIDATEARMAQQARVIRDAVASLGAGVTADLRRRYRKLVADRCRLAGLLP